MRKVYIESNGCAVLMHETERIAKYFVKNGWLLASAPEEGEVLVLTCCGVTRNEEDEAIRMLHRLECSRSAGSRIIVSGCMPAFAKERVLDVAPEAMILKYDELILLDGIIEASLPFQSIYYNAHPLLLGQGLGGTCDADSDLHLMRKIDNQCGTNICERAWDFSTLRRYIWQNDTTFQIRVSYGCPGNCSYCATKLGIGDFRSVERKQVMTQFVEGLAGGYTHFLLMGDEIGAYGRDIGSSLPDLLQEMHELSEGKPSVSIRYIHPDLLVKNYKVLQPFFVSGFIDYFCCAIQSGSPDVLKRMNRNPDIEPFVQCMEDMNRSHYPVNKHTQIIVGFPGETADDVLLTMDTLRRCQFDHININLYSPRRHTRAWNMENDVADEEKQFRAELIRHGMQLHKKSLLYDAIKVAMVQERDRQREKNMEA